MWHPLVCLERTFTEGKYSRQKWHWSGGVPGGGKGRGRLSIDMGRVLPPAGLRYGCARRLGRAFVNTGP
eukprot:15467683-Heterocapsa_arctica.AAC.1